MQERIIDNEITLIPYYPNPDALAWYQDPSLYKQVDNTDRVYDLDMLNRMYTFLSTHGECYYIRYRGVLVGDVTLRDNAEVCIVVSTAYQNRHIGRRCIRDMIVLAKEKGFIEIRANIYEFNMQSRKMFESVGFIQYAPEWFRYVLARTTDVYLSLIPATVFYHPVLPQERQDQLDATRNETVKAQRYMVWETMLKGLRHSRGLDAEAAKLTKDTFGKWSSGVCGISLSHCKTAVAAVVSDASVGVDIEAMEDPRYRDALLQRIASKTEQAAVEEIATELRIPVLWTRKEALFKCRGEQARHVLTENALDQTIRTVRVDLDRAYILSVACDPETTLRIFRTDGDSVAQISDWKQIPV